MGQGGQIYYKRIDDLGRLDMNSRTAAERVPVEWLKERVMNPSAKAAGLSLDEPENA